VDHSERAGDGESTPFLSVVIVTFNSEADLGGLLASLEKHTTFAHEVILVDNASTDSTPDLLDALERERRHRVIRNRENLGYSRAANQGARAARGRLVVFLNPDTRVPARWDAAMAAHLEPGVGAVGPLSNYVAAEQKVERHLREPLPARMDFAELARRVGEANRGRSHETKLLIGFCLMVPRAVLESLGGFDEDLFLGNDDLEFSLRLRRRGLRLVVATDVFVYHRGQVSFSSRPRAEVDRLVQESTDRLYEKLERLYAPEPVPSARELWGIEWFRPSALASAANAATPLAAPRVSIIIPVHNQLEYTKICLDALARHTIGVPLELIVVDNGSRDGTAEFLADCRTARVLTNPSNRGFPAAANQGIAAARGSVLVLLNNDTVVTEGWLEHLEKALGVSPDTGMAGPLTNRIRGIQQDPRAAYRTLDEMHAYAAELASRNAGRTIEVTQIMGFCMALRRSVVERIGGFDERFGIGNYDDDDLCLRARRAGFRIRVALDAFVHHFGSRTFAAVVQDYDQLLERNLRLFVDKWMAHPEGPIGQS
jgi:GT2 family glycosyltransferase